MYFCVIRPGGLPLGALEPGAILRLPAEEKQTGCPEAPCVPNLLIGLAVFVFVVVLGLLNQALRKAQSEQMARLWNERERWRAPTSRPRSGRSRR